MQADTHMDTHTQVRAYCCGLSTLSKTVDKSSNPNPFSNVH